MRFGNKAPRVMLAAGGALALWVAILSPELSVAPRMEAAAAPQAAACDRADGPLKVLFLGQEQPHAFRGGDLSGASRRRSRAAASS